MYGTFAKIKQLMNFGKQQYFYRRIEFRLRSNKPVAVSFTKDCVTLKNAKIVFSRVRI
jgi:hypothetical protein